MTAPSAAALTNVQGFSLALDRSYEPGTHMWVQAIASGRVRIGMDPLGVETSGTLAQLSLPASGSELTAGRPFGQLEAVKFVGPLTSPVSGTVVAINVAAAADAGLVERDPFGDGWLLEADLTEPAELGALLTDAGQIICWYREKITEYRLSGAIAR
jgi:glycine cleavage system H protein